MLIKDKKLQVKETNLNALTHRLSTFLIYKNLCDCDAPSSWMMNCLDCGGFFF